MYIQVKATLDLQPLFKTQGPTNPSIVNSES